MLSRSYLCVAEKLCQCPRSLSYTFVCIFIKLRLAPSYMMWSWMCRSVSPSMSRRSAPCWGTCWKTRWTPAGRSAVPLLLSVCGARGRTITSFSRWTIPAKRNRRGKTDGCSRPSGRAALAPVPGQFKGRRSAAAARPSSPIRTACFMRQFFCMGDGPFFPSWTERAIPVPRPSGRRW